MTGIEEGYTLKVNRNELMYLYESAVKNLGPTGVKIEVAQGVVDELRKLLEVGGLVK